MHQKPTLVNLSKGKEFKIFCDLWHIFISAISLPFTEPLEQCTRFHYISYNTQTVKILNTIKYSICRRLWSFKNLLCTSHIYIYVKKGSYYHMTSIERNGIIVNLDSVNKTYLFKLYRYICIHWRRKRLYW